MTLRSILALSFTIDQIQRNYGLDPAPALARHGMSKDQFDGNAVISQADELAILSDLFIDLSHDPLATVKIGSTFGLSGYGAYAMMLMSCSTVYESIQLGIRYQEMSYLFSKISFELDGENASIILTPYRVPEHLHRFVIDRDVAGTFQFLNLMQTMIGQHTHPLEICIPYPKPLEAEFYEKQFQCPVKFGTDVIRFLIPGDILKKTLPNANTTALTLYRQQCDELLSKRNQVNNGTLAERVKHHLEMFKEELPAIKDCAESFSSSERQFRRDLKEEGTTYQQLLDKVRSEKACKLLDNSKTSVEQIALLLGYTESAAFIRAFKKWHGITPAQYRKR